MKRLSIILSIIALMSLVAHAQTMTLEDCLTEGIDSSFQVRLVRIQQEQSANNDSWSNAGALPTVNLSGTYSTRDLENHSMNAQVRADWTVFDGFGVQATHQRLQQLHRQGDLQFRVSLEDYVASLASEYYNLVRQTIKLKNLEYAVSLSKERLRVARERYDMGGNSRLEYQQALVYFNADSAQSLKQHEALASARIRMNRIMSNSDLGRMIVAADTAIELSSMPDYETLLDWMMATNGSILKAESTSEMAQIDRRTVQSRNYPYLKLNAGYGVTHNIGSDMTSTDWSPNLGATVGMNIVTGKQRTQERNARLDVLSAEISQQQLELQLRANLDDLWQSYLNNLLLVELQESNLKTAQETMEVAQERYMLGDLSGIEMREAQKSLLDAEESLLQAQYDTKICEISLMQISGRLLDLLNLVKPVEYSGL